MKKPKFKTIREKPKFTIVVRDLSARRSKCINVYMDNKNFALAKFAKILNKFIEDYGKNPLKKKRSWKKK